MMLACLELQARSQTLAHKGWAGSGLTIDPWWKGAVFYQLDPLAFRPSTEDAGAFNSISQHLDYLQALGVDAVVLSPMPLQAPSAAKTSGSAFAAAYGTEEDFDQLQQALSLRRIRLIVDLPLSTSQTAEESLSMARFWLSRGVAGLRLVAGATSDQTLAPSDQAERLRLLKRLSAGYVGDRILLWDVAGMSPPEPEPHPLRGAHGADSTAPRPRLQVDHALEALTGWNAAAMRTILTGSQAPGALLVSDDPTQARSWTRLSAGTNDAARLATAKMIATVLLAGREQPMIFYGQEIGLASENGKPGPMRWLDEAAAPSHPEPAAASASLPQQDTDPQSLLRWYRKLSSLRGQGYALKNGTLMLVDTGYPDVVAWVRKGLTPGERPVLVMCNLSARPVLISVAQQLKELGVKPSSGMVPLALSFSGVNPSYTATGINLPAYGIYLGEILEPGLEDSPAPYVSHRRGR